MPELPGSRVMMVGPGASVGSFPVGGELERVSAGESQAPDPAWIASIANTLFSGSLGELVMGPGASPPKCSPWMRCRRRFEAPRMPHLWPLLPRRRRGQAACRGLAPQGRRRRYTRMSR